MRKILFITPPFHAGVVEVAGRWAPLSFVYLAGAARDAGLSVKIYDAMTKGVGHKEIEAKIKEFKPHYVATSAITCTLPDALKILETAKKINPNITTLLGGIHPTFMDEEVFRLSASVDFIIKGEGEKTLAEFLQVREAGGDISKVRGLAYKDGDSIVRTQTRPLMQAGEMDNLPKAWDLLDWEDYRYFIIPDSRLGAIDTSRGCTKDCTFCSQRKFWRQDWRARSPESLVKDVETMKNSYGVNVVLLTDDYPTLDRGRWERFLDLVIEKDLGIYFLMETRVEDILRDRDMLLKYRRAGIIHIYVGTEATDQSTLDLFKKDVKVEDAKKALRLLNEHGIITETSMILGLPDETRKSIERTLKLAKEYNPDFCHFLAISPWPYADIYEELKPYIQVFDYRKYNLIDPIIKPKEMTLEDIDRAIVDCYRQFYMGKLHEIMRMSDEFKKTYLLVSMKLMMTNSFLINKIGDLGKMPEEIARHMAMLDTAPRKHAMNI
ncbi:MAG: cobalamin B12-binding domain-containing protein [Deltaproteobacteria bacterium]|nr:cobalamin B12-binding domain-containing protein [Deltaproteobacteria bacterium]